MSFLMCAASLISALEPEIHIFFRFSRPEIANAARPVAGSYLITAAFMRPPATASIGSIISIRKMDLKMSTREERFARLSFFSTAAKIQSRKLLMLGIARNQLLSPTIRSIATPASQRPSANTGLGKKLKVSLGMVLPLMRF